MHKHVKNTFDPKTIQLLHILGLNLQQIAGRKQTFNKSKPAKRRNKIGKTYPFGSAHQGF